MRFVVPVIISCLLLSACGQKGPLYLPQEPVAGTNDKAEQEKNQTPDDTAEP